MSRLAGGDVIRVAPTNNVYTGLAAAGFAVTLVAVILFYLKAGDIGVALF